MTDNASKQITNQVIKRIFVLAVFTICFTLAWNFALAFFEPQISTDIALGQAQYDSTAAHNAIRAYGAAQNILNNVPLIAGVIAFFVTLWSIRKKVSAIMSADSKQAEQSPAPPKS